MKPARVVYWNNIPSPYVVERFNALASRGNLDFEAWFNERREADRSWDVKEQEWRFQARYIPERPVAGMRLRLPVPELRDVRPDLLVSLYSSTSFALGSFVARATGAQTAFRVLPTYDAWFERSKWKEALKHFLFKTVDGVKVPGPDGANMARRYGVPRDRIHAVTQSIDVAHYGQALEVTPAIRPKLREQLGLQGCVFLYVGRMWSGKGLDYLLDAYQRTRLEQPNTSLLLVGDGVDEARYQAMAQHLPNVTFAGFVQPRDLPGYYALADALVFPTLGDPHGLVVEEAMAAGLPVICSKAAGDIGRRLPDGVAGFVVPPANPAELSDRMSQLAASVDLRRQFAAEGQLIVARQVHEQWAIDFESFVDHVLSQPSRRTAQSLLGRVAGLAVLAAAGSDRNSSPNVGLAKEHVL
jgi:glycosyltransferase involved in cell wall biosynthesis